MRESTSKLKSIKGKKKIALGVLGAVSLGVVTSLTFKKKKSKG